MFHSLQPQGLQHSSLPCPSLFPRVCSNSCPLSRWWHPTISSSVTTFSSYPQPFLASESFPVSWFFTSGSQRIEASALAPVIPMNIRAWFPIGFDFAVQGTQESPPAPQFKSINSLALSLHYSPSLTSIHEHWKNDRFNYMDLSWQSVVSVF